MAAAPGGVDVNGRAGAQRLPPPDQCDAAGAEPARAAQRGADVDGQRDASPRYTKAGACGAGPPPGRLPPPPSARRVSGGQPRSLSFRSSNSSLEVLDSSTAAAVAAQQELHFEALIHSMTRHMLLGGVTESGRLDAVQLLAPMDGQTAAGYVNQLRIGGQSAASAALKLMEAAVESPQQVEVLMQNRALQNGVQAFLDFRPLRLRGLPAPTADEQYLWAAPGGLIARLADRSEEARGLLGGLLDKAGFDLHRCAALVSGCDLPQQTPVAGPPGPGLPTTAAAAAAPDDEVAAFGAMLLAFHAYCPTRNRALFAMHAQRDGGAVDAAAASTAAAEPAAEGGDVWVQLSGLSLQWDDAEGASRPTLAPTRISMAAACATPLELLIERLTVLKSPSGLAPAAFASCSLRVVATYAAPEHHAVLLDAGAAEALGYLLLSAPWPIYRRAGPLAALVALLPVVPSVAETLFGQLGLHTLLSMLCAPSAPYFLKEPAHEALVRGALDATFGPAVLRAMEGVFMLGRTPKRSSSDDTRVGATVPTDAAARRAVADVLVAAALRGSGCGVVPLATSGPGSGPSSPRAGALPKGVGELPARRAMANAAFTSSVGSAVAAGAALPRNHGDIPRPSALMARDSSASDGCSATAALLPLLRLLVHLLAGESLSGDGATITAMIGAIAAVAKCTAALRQVAIGLLGELMLTGSAPPRPQQPAAAGAAMEDWDCVEARPWGCPGPDPAPAAVAVARTRAAAALLKISELGLASRADLKQAVGPLVSLVRLAAESMAPPTRDAPDPMAMAWESAGVAYALAVLLRLVMSAPARAAIAEAGCATLLKTLLAANGLSAAAQSPCRSPRTSTAASAYMLGSPAEGLSNMRLADATAAANARATTSADAVRKPSFTGSSPSTTLVLGSCEPESDTSSESNSSGTSMQLSDAAAAGVDSAEPSSLTRGAESVDWATYDGRPAPVRPVVGPEALKLASMLMRYLRSVKG